MLCELASAIPVLWIATITCYAASARYLLVARWILLWIRLAAALLAVGFGLPSSLTATLASHSSQSFDPYMQAEQSPAAMC